MECLTEFVRVSTGDRSQYYKDLASPSTAINRRGLRT